MKTIALFRNGAVLSLTLFISACAGVDNIVSAARPAQPQARVVQPAPPVPEIKAPAIARPVVRPHTYQARIKRPAVIKPRPTVTRQYNKPVVNRYPGVAPKPAAPQVVAPPPPVKEVAPVMPIAAEPEDEGVDIDPYAEVPDSADGSHSTSPAVEALLVRAYADAKLGRLDAAMNKLERGLRIEPQNPKLWYQLAEVNYLAGNHQQAITMAKKAIELSSSDEEMTGKNWQLISKVAKKSGDSGALAEAEAYNKR